jgi:hypothetical protein
VRGSRQLGEQTAAVDHDRDPDGVSLDAVDDTVAAGDEFPIAKIREFGDDATALGEGGELLGGVEDPLDERLGAPGESRAMKS